MEEPSLLMPMQRVIGGIQIQNDLLRRPAGAVQKGIDKEGIQGLGGVGDLLGVKILHLSRPIGLQPVQGALPGQSLPTIPRMPSVLPAGIQLPTLCRAPDYAESLREFLCWKGFGK